MEKLNWIKHGEMNGTNEGIMQSLLTFLPDGPSISGPEQFKQYDVARSYMTELWLRGVTKEQFIKWVQENAASQESRV